MDNLKMSADEVNYVELTTRNQAASAIWHNQRVGRISSSTVHKVLRTNALHPAPSLVMKICQSYLRQLRVPAIQWGNNNEDNAFSLYVNLNTGARQKPDIMPSGVIMTTNRGQHQDFFQFNVPFKIILLIETSQSIGGAKQEYPGETT